MYKEADIALVIKRSKQEMIYWNEIYRLRDRYSSSLLQLLVRLKATNPESPLIYQANKLLLLLRSSPRTQRFQCRVGMAKAAGAMLQAWFEGENPLLGAV